MYKVSELVPKGYINDSFCKMVIKNRSLTVLTNSPGNVDINVHEEVPLHTVHVCHRLW